MLSVNYIYNFLDNKQLRIEKSIYNKIPDFEINKNPSESDLKIGKFHLALPNSFEIIFNKSINNFYYDNKIFKNKSQIFTLINSIFNITNELFDFYGEQEKETIIKDFILKMDSDLFEKNLYTKFNYIKNRKFNKSSIQEVLKDAFQFKCNDKFNLFKEYLSDYLGINIYIFHLENNIINFLNCEKYTPSYFGNNINMILPNFVIICENNIFKGILNYNEDKSYESSILDYSKYEVIINNIWNYLKIERKETELIICSGERERERNKLINHFNNFVLQQQKTVLLLIVFELIREFNSK
jgi:hypothetical protein